MADLLTQLKDVKYWDQYTKYLNLFTSEKSAIIQSGVAVANADVSKNITAGGLKVEMPFWNDLSGDDEVLDDGEEGLSTGNIDASSSTACVLYRGRGWAVNELAAVISGDDPLGALMSKIGTYWLRREQTLLLSVLNGLFAPGSGSGENATPAGCLVESHLNDQKGNKIESSLILDTKQLLGDASGQLSMIVMHSAIFTSLQKLNLIEYIPDARGEIQFPTYLGYRIVVDDGVPKTGNGANTVYTTYLFAAGSIGRNTGNPDKLTLFETARDAKKGNDEIYTRRALTMHPMGTTWLDAERPDGKKTPTNAELMNPANWKKVYEDKKIGIVALNCKAQ